MVAAMHMIYDFSSRKKAFKESGFVAGYILSSLGRGLLHGDSESTGDRPLTMWKVKCVDFIALQGEYPLSFFFLVLLCTSIGCLPFASFSLR